MLRIFRYERRKTKDEGRRPACPAFVLRPSSFVSNSLAFLIIASLLLGLCACADQSEQALASGGGITPQGVVEGFFEDFNQALKEVPQNDTIRRRYWTDRLASYFAANERSDQRESLEQALFTFAGGSKQLPADQKLSLDVSYGRLELVQLEENRAQVRIVDGLLRLKIVRVASDGAQIPLRTDERPLGETIGQPNGIVPLVRVNDRWYLTEG